MILYLEQLANLKHLPNIGDAINITSNNSHFKSIRPKIGDKLEVTNLQGILMNTEVLDYDFKSGNGRIKILSTKKDNNDDSKRVLIQAIIAKEYLEKLVEIAPIAKITTIIIANSNYSQKYNLTETHKNRLESILIRACEQSHCLHKPIIEYRLDTNIDNSDMISEYCKTKIVVMELPSKNSAASKNKDNLEKKNSTTTSNITVIVGAEGGFDHNELNNFKAKESENLLRIESLNVGILPAWLAGYSYFLSL